MTGGGELLRGLLAASEPLKVRPRWYTVRQLFAAGAAVGSTQEATLQLNTEAYFLWTNTYFAHIDDPFSANPISIFPRQAAFTVTQEFSTGFKRTDKPQIEVNFPFSLNFSSTHSEYHLFDPGDAIRFAFNRQLLTIEAQVILVLEGVEYVF